jgi:hypothetical protein
MTINITNIHVNGLQGKEKSLILSRKIINKVQHGIIEIRPKQS